MSSREADNARVADAGGYAEEPGGPDGDKFVGGPDGDKFVGGADDDQPSPGHDPPPDGDPSPTRVEEIAKLLLGAAGLVVLAGLLSIIPPLERTVPGTPDGVFVSFETLVTGLVTVVVVGLFLVVADELEALVVERLPGRDPLVADAGAVVKYLVVFLVLVAAYGPLAAVATPFLTPSDTVWVFDLAFVLVALLPLGEVASIVVGDLDDLASVFVDAFRTASERVESGSAPRTEVDRSDDHRSDDHRSDDDRTGEESTVSSDSTDVVTGRDAGPDEGLDESADGAREDGTDPAKPAAEETVEAGPNREE
jgi:hypothetical protein